MKSYSELNDKLLPELREYAKGLGIKRVEAFRKQDLIRKIMDAEDPDFEDEIDDDDDLLVGVTDIMAPLPERNIRSSETADDDEEEKDSEDGADIIRSIEGVSAEQEFSLR